MKQEWIYFSDFMFFMKQHDSYLAYITNTEKAGHDPEDIFKKVSKSRGRIETVLRRSFDYEESPEGYKYWKDCEDCLIGTFMDRFPKSYAK